MKKKILSMAVASVFAANAFSATSLQELKVKNPHVDQREAVDATFDKDKFRHAITLEKGKVRVIFQLEDVPAALFPAVNPSVNVQSSNKTIGDINFSSKAAKEYKNFLLQKQNTLLTAAAQIDPSLKSDIRYTTLANGFAAVVDKSKLQQLSKLPGVKAIYPDTLMHSTMEQSLDLIKAPQLWEMLGGYSEAGKGIKVGILDSGLRPENPLFSGEGFEAPDDAPTDDYCATVDPAFCNGKIISARAATVPAGFILAEGEFNGSPMAFNGHGTHVAGTAVGNWGVQATAGDLTATISGVAPAAHLMVYKGLYATAENPASSSGASSMLVEMLEASVEDGADVVNNSWGGGSSIVSPFYEDVFLAAKEAGTTMVFAAGNSGNGASTIGSPGTSGEVLTVAASTTDRFTANFFSLDGADVSDALALTAGPIAVDEAITLPIVYSGSVEPDNFEGCLPFAEAETAIFDGAMALISRGSCAFTDKIVNAQNAGASGVIIFNNQPDAAPINMSVDDTVITVPAAMIGTNAGLSTVEALASDAEVQATLSASVSVPDSIAGFSSRGPNADVAIFKPNLTAPGVGIFSGESPIAPGSNGDSFSLKSGTSMASPHVAGAAALIKQINPDWTPDQIMSAVTSTTVRDTLLNDDLESAPDGFDMGSGRLDLERAAKAQLTFSELGLADSNCFVTCEFAVAVTNTSDADISVSVNEMMMTEGYSVSVSPGDATLTAGSTTDLTITVNTTGATQFGDWVFGSVEWDDGNADTPEYYLPIAVNAVETEDPGLLNTDSTSSVVEAGEMVTLSATIDNLNLTDEITLTAEFAEGFAVSEDSILAAVEGNAQPVTFDAATNTAAWNGTLGSADFAIAPDSKPRQDLANFGLDFFSMVAYGVEPFECSVTCDDSYITIQPSVPVNFGGTEYTTMHVSSNGFLILGDNDEGASFSQTQSLPSLNAPNNVVAPLWMDLDLADSDGAGSGTIHASLLDLNSRFGCDTCSDYYVVEWNNAEIYGVPGETYTFQVLFELSTGKAYFNYDALGSFPAELNQFGLGMTVGVENDTGTAGVTQARIESDNSVAGTLPTQGDVWGLTVSKGQSLDFSVMGALEEREPLMDDSLQLLEDTDAMVDVLENDGADPAVNTFTVSSGDTNVRSFKTLNYDFNSFDRSTLAISTGPANGTASVVDGKINYTPNENYFGADSIEYTVTDGTETYSAMVNMTVENVNDSPVIESITAPTSVDEGDVVIISVQTSDADNDDLTVTINGEVGPSVTLMAPEVKGDGGTIEVNVTVSDGTETITQSTSVNVENVKESGSLAWYSLLLLPLTWLRRRKLK